MCALTAVLTLARCRKSKIQNLKDGTKKQEPGCRPQKTVRPDRQFGAGESYHRYPGVGPGHTWRISQEPVLIVHGTFLGGPLPEGVDAVVTENDDGDLLHTLKQFKPK